MKRNDTGNRPRGKLRKVSMKQFVTWTRDWRAYDKAPQLYRLTGDRRIIPLMDARTFRRSCWAAYHSFVSPRELAFPCMTLYYDCV